MRSFLVAIAAMWLSFTLYLAVESYRVGYGKGWIEGGAYLKSHGIKVGRCQAGCEQRGLEGTYTDARCWCSADAAGGAQP